MGKIYVVSHKAYDMPASSLYQPMQVGFGEDLEGFLRDNTGDNIAHKNANYSELTAIYWLWKNSQDDFVGIDHYRRLLADDRRIEEEKAVLGEDRLHELLEEYDIVLPKVRNYYIETNYSQYAHAHYAKDLDLTREIVEERCPEYLDAFDARMRMTKGHKLNMMIARKDVFNAYCEWLFGILFELEGSVDISNYSDYDKRIYGFISERLLDVWIDYQGLKVYELPVIETEKVNWLVKGSKFLIRKFRGKRV